MNKTVTIFGLGAIGSNLGYNLFQAEPRLIINGIDKDIVEQRNLGNQIYSQPFVGQSKVDAFVAELYMRTQSMPKGKFIKAELGKDRLSLDGLFVDAFDNFKSRDILHQIAKSRNVESEIVHLGFGVIDKSLFGTIQWNGSFQTGQTDAPGQDVCQIPDATWWIKGAVAIMTLNVLNFLRKGEVKNLVIKPDLSTKNL